MTARPVRGRSTVAAAVLGLFAACALAACSSHRPLHAAEPATAPATKAAPAGSVVPVGERPEGVVYDPKNDLVAVAVRNPDRLLLLDATTLAVRRAVPLPGTVRHLQLAAPGGPVLVPVESADQLVEVFLPDGRSRSTAVGRQPHDATAVSGGRIVVGNEFGKSISILKDGTTLATRPVVQQPGGVIGDGAEVALVDVAAFTVSTLDLETPGATPVVVAGGAGPTHGAMTSTGRLVVTDTRGDALLLFGLQPLARVGSLPLPGTPYGLAVDRTTDTAWVTLTARNEVVGIDVSTTTPRIIARYATVRQPNTVAVAPGGHELWITGTATGVVQRISR